MLSLVCRYVDKAKMNMMTVSVLMQLIAHVTSTLLSVQVTSYKNLRNETNGPVLCAMDLVNKTMSSSSLEHCSLSCMRDDTCIGFNIKSSLTCDHVTTPVLASTSRTHSPVMCTVIIQDSLHLS